MLHLNLAFLLILLYNYVHIIKKRVIIMLEYIKTNDSQFYMNTFGNRLPVCFDHGKGIKLYSSDNEEYYDFLGGIAVNSIGHCHHYFVEKLQEQISKLIHVSNLYYINSQTKLAKRLVEKTCMDKVFFANSGAEANEGAFKLAKMYFYKKNSPKYEIISLDHSFHGRTLATVAATGQEKYQKPYKPLTPGFIQVEANNLDALKSAITDKTAAILLEPIQGESGVHPMNVDYLKAVRELCDQNDILLIFDEVQTGMGRCGKLFAYELFGVEPDILTSAKALGGGVPIGAVLSKNFVASAFEPGDHGSTFGGNPLATAAGNAVLDIYENEKLVENCEAMGQLFKNKLLALKEKYPNKITDVRGYGLLIGTELEESIAKPVFEKLFQNKILTSLCYTTIRVAPPLVITENDVDYFINTLDFILKGIN